MKTATTESEMGYRSFYKQVQFIGDNDNRTLEERIKSLPNIREEDLYEWKNWADHNVLDR